MARIFLAILGVLYIGLGLWCSFAPQRTSRVVGFELQPGTGQSEFLTVYGGLEVGLGLVFLWPAITGQDIKIVLLASLIIHAALVLFRSLGFLAFSGFTRNTYQLAVAEWVIFLAAAALYWRHSGSAS